MTYGNGNAFRRALEDRLLTQSTHESVALNRLRKMVAFDRFLARLLTAQSGAWMLKGGLALQLRLGDCARTTKDVDVLLTISQIGAYQALAQAAAHDLSDWFTFVVRSEVGTLPGPDEGGLRFYVTARVDGRVFESFHIDVGLGDPVVEPAEHLTTPPLLAFADIPPVVVPCYPISQHLAEKIHAYVKPRASGEGTRVKDLVDMVLIAMHAPVNAGALTAALQATFTAQGSGAPPRSLPAPPAAWAPKYRRLAQEVGLDDLTLPAAFERARHFLDPVLSGQTTGRWSPPIQA